ncbi:MAG: N-acetylneuraminate synthase family protein [Candidatus Andersenbacteria bacterium]|nr:N-acetylneuraminate synthase family protein [Candidatus Andersenbacteria bacterium]
MSVKPLGVGQRKIGPGEPVFVIAEAGINHNGSEQRAYELIDAAVEAGADAVKFQKRNLAEVYQKKILDNPNSAEQKYQYLIPLLKECQLNDEVYPRLEAYAQEKGIMFLVNPWDKGSLKDIEELLHVPLYKVGSPDFTNNELLEAIAAVGKPMIISTGMAQEKEIEAGVNFIKSLNVPFALLHCNSTYPAPFDEINLKYMDVLKQYGVPVGYSGHERGIAVAIAAVALGACVIERHITVDKTLEGPDHIASLLTEEFKLMVTGIRQVEISLGEGGVKKLSRGEIMNREILGKSVVAKTFIADGTVMTREMLTTKSPAKGLSPQRIHELIGIKATRDIFEGEALTEDDVEADSILTNFDSSGIKWTWGPVVRWKDYAGYLKYNPGLFEFHLSDKDLDEDLPKGDFSQQVIVHMPEYMGRVYLNPAAEDPGERKIAVETLQRSIDVARRLGESFKGKPKFVVHPGGITLTPAKDPKKLLDLFADTLSQLKTDGVDVLPENMPPRPWVFGGEWVTNIFLTGEEIKEFLDKTGYNMCFDTSHATLACNAAGVSLVDMITLLKPYIRHLHVADGEGIGEEGLQIGAGTVDFAAVLAPLKGYQYTMVPEIWQGHLHGGKGFLKAMEKLKPYMQ